MKTSFLVRWFGLALMVYCLTATVGVADGFIVIGPPWPWPPPFVPVPHPYPYPIPPPQPVYTFAPLEVTYHHVTVKITDQAAVTTVDQAFHNPNSQRLEGTYLFPIPQGGQIDKFSMDINGKTVDAELVDAEKARKLYEDIVRKVRDPALLEYAGQGLFKARIFPIEPNSDKRIQITYTQLLRSDGGMVEYVYPLNTEKFSAQPIKNVSVKVDLECKRSIKTVYSPSHAVETKRSGDKKAVIGYEANDVKPDTDFKLYFSRDDKADVGLSVLAFNEGAGAPEGGYFALFASPAADVMAGPIVAKDVVFVLDTSGSMAENDKLEQAKKALTFCLKNLNKDDRFEVVRFSTEAEALFGKLVAPDDQDRGKAEAFVKDLKPRGGTAIEEALLKALESAKTQGEKDRPYVVVFLTDGKPTIGNTDEDSLVANVSKASVDRSVRIFCFGIGTDVNTHLLDRLAEKTRAVSQYVLPSEDLEIKVSSFYAKINDPVLANLKLSFSGAVKPSKMYPSDLPDLFKGDQLVVLGRYSGAGDAAVTVAGTVNGKSRAFVCEAAFPDKASDYTFVPRLWATRRVGYLLDEIRLHGDSKELRDEVTDLARKYGIVTPYTAYLIAEDESHRDIPAASRSMPTLSRNVDALRGAEQMFESATTDREGAGAVGSANAYRTLKSAANMAAPAAASSFGYEGQTGSAAPVARTIEQSLQAQPMRHVRGRTFYWNDGLWIDATLQGHENAKKAQVKFGSDEYFALLTKHPEAAPWFSVGTRVRLWLDETVYEVEE